jgi:hypothetical protein
VSAVGDRFVAAVARGRREYGHPKQLAALVKSGFISEEASEWRTQPREIPLEAERLFYEATPRHGLRGAQLLPWDEEGQLRYYMFRRRIDSWNPA